MQEDDKVFLIKHKNICLINLELDQLLYKIEMSSWDLIFIYFSKVKTIVLK
jgi:hypothetical protein